MDLFIALKSRAERDLEHEMRQGQPETIRKISFNIDKGATVFEAWVMRSHGEMVVDSGASLVAKVPGDRLDELADILRQYGEATEAAVCCGVGIEPSEAQTALTVAEARGGDKPVLYTPEVAEEARELREQNEDEDGLTEDDHAALEEPTGFAPVKKAAFDEGKEPGEATQVQQGGLSPTHLQPSAPSPMSPPPSPQSPSGSPPGQGAEPAPGQAQGPQQLKQVIATVLQDVKKQMPLLQQMQQQAPDAFKAVMGLVQAMLAMADQVFGAPQGGQPAGGEQQPPQGEPTQKAEVKGAAKPAHALKPNPHHHVVLPVGSQHGQRVKVVHADGKQSWVSVKAGQVESDDGHPISSLNPGGR